MNNKKISIAVALSCCLCFPLGAQKAKTLTLLQTSDTHSRIEPIPEATADTYAGMGGFVRRATMVKQLRQENPGLLLFDCGDLSQGTPYYNLFQGEIEIRLMSQMRYDAVAIGNHEFDFGLENMARLFKMATFPVVCANYDVKGTVLEGLVKPYTIIEREGLRIGVFGLSPMLDGLVQADKCVGVGFNDPVTVANEIAALLKIEEQCDAVICLSHLGVDYDSTQLLPKTRNIDVVLGGHSHTFMQKPEQIENLDGKQIPLLHTGRGGVFVGQTQLTFL